MAGWSIMDVRIGPLTYDDRRLLFEDALLNSRTPQQQALVLLRESLHRRHRQRAKRRSAHHSETTVGASERINALTPSD
jgi:hypothetical protein